MTDFEKIEKIRQHANVTFEEAKQALDAANGDILDAIIWLERRGKTGGPEQSVHSTRYEDHKDYVSVNETVKRNEEKQSYTGNKFVRGFKRVWHFFTDNYFVVSKNGQDVAVLPLLLVIILLICLFFLSLAALIVMLFFGFQYSFRGKNSQGTTGEYMNRAAAAASEFAEKVKDDFKEI